MESANQLHSWSEAMPSSAHPSGPLRVRFRPMLALAVIGGGLCWLAFFFPWLSYVCLVPFILLIRLPADRRLLYIAAWVGGLAYYLPGIYWLQYCDPGLGAKAAWILLANYMALYVPSFVLIARIGHRRWKLPLLVVVPVAWTFLEYFRMHFLSGFGWLFLAHNLYRSTTVIQLADIGGVYAVTFFICLVNAFFAELLTLPLFRRTNSGRSIDPEMFSHAFITVTVIAGTIYYGWHQRSTAAFTDGPTVMMVQTNLPQSLKQNDADVTFEHIIDATKDAVTGSADLVVWPETSYPYALGKLEAKLNDQEIDRLRRRRSGRPESDASAEQGELLRRNIVGGQRELERLTDELDKPLLVGAIYIRLDQVVREHNSSILFAPQLGEVARYDKIHLVPFGEFLPLKESIPILRFLMPYGDDVEFGLDAAADFAVIHWRNLHFASLICFEDTLPHLAREFMKRATAEYPVDFFVNQSNDGWFQGSMEAEYHLAASVFRCVEGRVPMVRVSNVGYSSLVNGNGEIIIQAPSLTMAGILTAVVPLDHRTSLYLAWGDWLPKACGAVIIALMAASTIHHGQTFWRKLREKGDLPDQL